MIRIDKKILDDISANARLSARKRQNHNFHKGNEELLQRMLNALEPGTYIRPHKHENPDKNEVFIVLKGRILVVEFNDDGSLFEYIILDKNTQNHAAEIPPGRFHSMISLETGTVAYEIKEGPYFPDTVKIFAPWSPEEGSPDTDTFIQKILNYLNIN